MRMSKGHTARTKGTDKPAAKLLKTERTKVTTMKTKGRAKRRIAIILAAIMALQCMVFGTSAFAATDGDVLNVHITNAYWTVKASENGQAVPFETGFTMTKGQGKGMTASGSLSFVGGKNLKSSGNGVKYTFLNVYVLNEGGPVYRDSVASSEAIQKINYKGSGEVLVTFQDTSTTTLNTTDLYISPAYKVDASWRLSYKYIDNISTGSGSWYNNTGSTSSFSHTFKDPSKGTWQDHYRFVNWTDFETGNTYGEGSKYTYQPKDQAFLNSYYAENGSLFEDEVNIYAVWQPSVIVNWNGAAGEQLHSEEAFYEAIATENFAGSDIETEVNGEAVTFTFTGWTDENGNAADGMSFEAPEVTTVPVDQKVIDLYANYSTSKSVQMIWNDAADKDGIRPESVEVTLLANGEAAGTAVLSAENDWTYTFEDLAAYENGEIVSYTVSSEAPADYENEIESTVLMDTITSIHEPKVVDITNDITPVLPAGPTAPTDNGTPQSPAAPAASTPAAAPAQQTLIVPMVAPAQASEAPAQNSITEASAPMAAPVSEEIAEEAAPMAATGYWALINLILAAATALMSLLAMAFYFIRKRDDSEEENEDNEIRRKGMMRVLTVIPAVLAVITFLLTENMANPMRLVDDWTLLMAVIFAAGAVLTVLSRKTVKENEEKEELAAEMM